MPVRRYLRPKVRVATGHCRALPILLGTMVPRACERTESGRGPGQLRTGSSYPVLAASGKQFRERPRTAILLGDELRIVVGAARSLARQGVRVVVVLSPHAPPLRSRSVDAVVRLPRASGGAEASAAATVAVLMGLAERGPAVLFPCTDSALALVAQHERLLRSAMHVAAPSAPVVEAVLSKDVTLQTAMRCGIEVPKAWSIGSRAALLGCRDELRFPLVAKPRDKRSAAEFKTRYYRGLPELERAFMADDTFGRRNLLQEFCPGEGVLVGVIMNHGEPLTLVQHRRLRELPATGGVAVLAETEPLDAEVGDASVRLLRELGWHGVAAVEYRHDRTTGRWVLMEVNGRFWGTHAITQHAGVDFPALAWELACGADPAAAPPPRPGVRTLWVAGAVKRAYDLSRGETQGVDRPSGWRGWADLVTDVAHCKLTLLGSWKDPWPLADELARTAVEILEAESRRLACALAPAPFEVG